MTVVGNWMWCCRIHLVPHVVGVVGNMLPEEVVAAAAAARMLEEGGAAQMMMLEEEVLVRFLDHLNWRPSQEHLRSPCRFVK